MYLPRTYVPWNVANHNLTSRDILAVVSLVLYKMCCDSLGSTALVLKWRAHFSSCPGPSISRGSRHLLCQLKTAVRARYAATATLLKATQQAEQHIWASCSSVWQRVAAAIRQQLGEPRCQANVHLFCGPVFSCDYLYSATVTGNECSPKHRVPSRTGSSRPQQGANEQACIRVCSREFGSCKRQAPLVLGS